MSIAGHSRSRATAARGSWAPPERLQPRGPAGDPRGRPRPRDGAPLRLGPAGRVGREGPRAHRPVCGALGRGRAGGVGHAPCRPLRCARARRAQPRRSWTGEDLLLHVSSARGRGLADAPSTLPASSASSSSAGARPGPDGCRQRSVAQVAAKAGFTAEGFLREYGERGGRRHDMVLYARLHSDPRPAFEALEM